MGVFFRRRAALLSLVWAAASGEPLLSLEDYNAARRQLMEDNAALSFDAGTELTVIEETMDARLASLRNSYVERTKADGSFAPSRYFHEWNLTEVRSDPVFQFLDGLPKGANLHLHSGSLGSLDWVLTEGMAMEGCHVFWGDESDTQCINATGGSVFYCPNGARAKLLRGTLAFYRAGASPPGFEPCAALVDGQVGFRQALGSMLSTGRANAGEDSGQTWQTMDRVFSRLGPANKYRPFVQAYVEHALGIHLDTGVSHIEVRVTCASGGMCSVYDLHSTSLGGSSLIDVYQQALHSFQARSPRHAKMTMKIIAATIRVFPADRIREDLDFAASLRLSYPDFVVGFDAVGEEDPSHRTLDYVGAFLHARRHEQETGIDLPLFLHDGESDDRDNSNVVDAVLLGCPRVGHGVNAGMFFPAVTAEMKRRGTVVEVNPISNQVLHYVEDLETHPAAPLALGGVRIVLASDDPAVYAYSGVTLDWWAATMAWRLDLRSLKTLAYNSLEFSALSHTEKEVALRRWRIEWEAYVEAQVNPVQQQVSEQLPQRSIVVGYM